MDLTSERAAQPSLSASPVDVVIDGPPAKASPVPGDESTAGTTARPLARGGKWLAAGVAAALVAGVVVRFAPRGALWLDEALTVNISRLPLGDIAGALRRDGAPPLYYYLLHFWMQLFGSGDWAVRALPALLGAASIPLTWMAASRLAGRRVAWVAALLMASSPFAVSYSVETRMYSLLIFLALAGYLAVDSALRHPARRGRLVVVAGVTAALLLSHYWSMFLVGVAAVALLVVARRGDRGARRALVAMGAGSLLFLPWVPSFLYQIRHTGAPWGKPAAMRSFFDTVNSFAGGNWDPGLALGLLFWGLMVLALFGRGIDNRRIELDLRPSGPGKRVAIIGGATLLTGLLSTRVTDSAFAVRYTAVVFPFVLLLVALGTRVLLDRRVHNGVVALAVMFGFWSIAPGLVIPRTTAPRVASVLAAQARPGDVIAYCPDQLGPSVSRRLPPGLDQLTFPRGTPPEFVDWVDYADVNRATEVGPFADMLLQRAGSSTIWVVWAPAYPTFSDKCQRLLTLLQEARPGGSRVVKLPTRRFERMGLAQFPAP